MALELSELKFVVNDSDLKRASDTIGELVTNVGKLDKAARDAAQTEATLARAAKLNADANLQNAKAQDVRLKSTITADKADQQAAAAIERKTKATERASTAIKKNADMLQLQNDTYDFILEGFSKGDAKVLAMAKATGQLSDQLKQVLTDIRQFSKNTFDQTETGLDRMVKSAKEASSAQGFLNNGLNLTSKQAKELSNDLDRLNIRLQHQGKSYQEITKEQAIYKQRFVEEANAVNRATSALAVVEKQRKDVVSATNYLTQAEAKMAAALNLSNAALDKAGTDSLVKYESALRKSGVSQDVATQKLATYKAQLAQVQEQEMKRREQHLTRAISPQLMDIGVSLYSGQSPLTVLIQQSGQLVDLFQLSGVEAGKLGEAMRKSFYSMVPAIATVTKELASLFFGMFVDAGRGITSFISNATGLNKVLQDTDDILYLIGGRVTWFSKILHTLGTIASVTFGTGVLAIVAGLAALAVGLKQVITENNDLAKAFALSGASIGLSHTQMIGYVKTLADSGATTGQATEALLAMAKTGNFTSSEILLVSDAAIQMQKGFGIAIEDTVKQFAKLKEKPVEALLEIAKSSGMVGPEVIKMVQELERAGKSTEAASVAMKAYANVTKQQVAQMKENYNGFALFMIDLGQKIKQFFSDTFKTLFLATDPNQQLEDQLVKLRERIKDVSATLESNKSWGISGDPKLLNSLKEQERMIISQIGAQVRLRGEEEKRKYLNAENAKYESAIADLRGNALGAIEKETRKTQTLAEFRKSFINDKLKEAAKEKSVDIEKLKLNTDLMNVLQQQADIEYNKTQKSGSKSENYFATLMREATNNTIAANTAAQELTKSEQKLLEVRSDPRFEKLTATQKQDVISKYEAAIAAEKQTALTEKLAEAEEHRLKLLGKSEGIGKQYYSDMQKLEEFAKVAGWSRGEVEELTRAVFMATPAWKAYEKALEDVNSAARKFNEDSIASQAATLKENESLDYRLSLLGKTAEEQRALSIEYNRANKLSEVRIKLAKQLRDIEADIEKAKKAGLPEEKYKNLIDAQVQARKDAAEQEKVINREVAVQAKEDFQKEFDAIKNGISDSIVTALFEGGKAGSKKFRDLVVAELRKPVTMVVNAVVNTVLGNIVGSLMGGAAAGAAGGAAGGIAGSIGSSIAGSAIMSGIGMMGTEGLANIVGFLGGDALGVLGAGASGGFSSAIATAIGQIPVWGWIAGGLLAIASVLDDSGTYHTGGAAQYSSAGGQRNSLGFRDNEEGLPSYNPNDNIDNQFGTGFGYVETGKETISAMETLSKSLVEIFDGIAKTFGKTAGYEVAVAFADDTSKDGAWGAFAVRLQGVEILNWEDFRQSKWAPKEFGDGEEGYKQYLAAIAKDTRQVILDMDLPGWADQVLNDIGDAPSLESLSKAIQELAQMKSMYDLMTSQMVNFAGITDEAFGKLIKEFGDIGTMTNQVAGYYQNYYSEFERFNKAQADVTKSFTDLGLTMPTSREEFRKLAESQDLNTEAGRKMYAQLMALAASFGVVIDATEQLANARTDIVYRMMEQEALLLEAQGRTADADKKRREILDKQRGAEYERLMKVNPELARLTAELWALEDAAVAAAKVKEIADTRQDLTDRILQQEADLLDAQGRTAEADRKRRELLDRQRARENERLMALNPELAKLAYELWLLEDATAAATRAAALEREISDNRRDYTDRILQQEAALLNAQGRTAEADKKRRELLDRQRGAEYERLMKINPELAKLAYELWLLEDATAAATEAAALRTKKIDESYSQLQKAVEAEKKVLNERIETSQELINTLTAIFDTVSGAVKELYNQVDSTAAMSFQSAKSYISGVFNSVMQGGSIGDSKLLTTAVEDAMAGLSANNYRTKADYDRERLRLAGQLALIGDSAEESLTNEQKVLKGLKDQIDKLDETLAYWKDMIDIANGTYVATVSVTQAVNQLTELLRTVTSPDGKGEKPMPKPVGTEKPSGGGTGSTPVFGGGGGGSSSQSYSYYRPVGLGTSIGYQPVTDEATISRLDKLSSLYHSFDGTGDLVGLLNSIKAAGGTMYDLEALSGHFYNNWVKAGMSVGIPAFAEGGNYRGGVALVGEEGPELINFNQGGYVHTASQTASMLSGNSGLEARIANLERAAVNTANALTQIANNTKRTADTLRNISPNGDSIQVESESFLEL